MTKTLTCSQGHHWQVPDDALVRSELPDFACPMCGAEAETVSDAMSLHETNNDDQPLGTPNDPNRLTGYEILDEAGRGGMGIVYRALDRQHDRIVALKTLQRIGPVALQRFKSEFRSLSDVAHRNLVSLYELISDGENWCFTMELIDGVDLLQYIRHGATGHSEPDISSAADVTIDLSVADLQAGGQRGLSADQLDRLRSVTAQLAAAISALHSAGILHRDIKPSNVLVTKEGRAVVLDFGLAAALDNSDVHRNSQDSILGTVAYMSPEQAASETVSHATDWYALGSLLYEALTGRTPFKGKTLAVLQAKQREDPLAPSNIWPDVPSDLEELCIGLLARDPAHRATGSDVLRVLQQDEFAIDSQGEFNEEPDQLIGREQHLASLHEAYGSVMEGRAASVFVWGESGNGKSTLVKHFLDGIQGDKDAVVLAGRCYERESVPFKAIDSLIDSLVAHLKHVSRAEAEGVMPRDIQALMRLFPVIGQIEAAAKMPRRKIEVSDQQELNRRAIGALREMLARMGDRCRLVVYIDDLQWGDEDSAAMVSDLLQPPDSPVVLFLGTYRSEDAETSPFLQGFRQIQGQRDVPLESLQVEVKPLAHADAVRLALDLLGRDDENAQSDAEAVAKEAAGNPFFVSEMVKHLQLEGARNSDSTGSLAVADMIWSRVRRLPEESQRLLEVVALWGQPLPLEQAMHIADAGQSSVGPLRTGHLIRTVGMSSSSIIETYHDRVRESVAARLEQSTKQQRHLRIAEEYARHTIQNAEGILDRFSAPNTASSATASSATTADEHQVDASWYDIAFHYDAAGRSDLAFPYAFATAESARIQCSLEVAERQFRIAERGVGDYDDQVRYHVAKGLGDVLMLRGNYDESKTQFDAAMKLSPDDRPQIEAQLGELAHKQGDMRTSMEAIERALQLLGYKVPQSSGAFYFRLAGEAIVQILHTLLPKIFLARKPLQDVEKELLVIRLHNRLAYAYWFGRGKFPCLWTHLRGMNLAECYPATPELGQAYSIHAPVMSLVGYFNRGIAYAKKSLAIYESLGDAWGQGQSLHFCGVNLYAASKYEECIEKCREGMRLLEQTGDLWEVSIARYHVANSLYRLGDLRGAVAEAMRVYQSGVELGALQESGICMDVWAPASGGRIPADVLQSQLQLPREDLHVTAQVMFAEGVRLFTEDRFEEAGAVFKKGYRVAAEEGGIKSAWTYPLRCWLASSLRRQAEETPELEPKQRASLLHRANQLARKAVKTARQFRNDLPHALRECGLLAAVRGKVPKARKYLDESLAVAEEQGARFEYSQTLLARGRLGQQHGWPGAEQDRKTAEQTLRDIGAEFVLEAADRATAQ